MANNMRYFIGNWKMFGEPSSVSILKNINDFIKSDDKFSKLYEVVITPPHTLIESYSEIFLNEKIKIGAQNCYHKDNFGANTGAVSAYMLKSVGAKYVIIGHSENRNTGETDKLINLKIKSAIMYIHLHRLPDVEAFCVYYCPILKQTIQPSNHFYKQKCFGANCVCTTITFRSNEPRYRGTGGRGGCLPTQPRIHHWSPS